MVASARRGDEQNRWLYVAGGGGLALGLLLYAVLADPIARVTPDSWRWPERMATRTLGEAAMGCGAAVDADGRARELGVDRRGLAARRCQPRGGASVPRAGREGEKAGALHDRGETTEF
jgi:hypothetical protein